MGTHDLGMRAVFCQLSQGCLLCLVDPSSEKWWKQAACSGAIIELGLPGLEPGSVDSESTVLTNYTTGPLHLWRDSNPQSFLFRRGMRLPLRYIAYALLCLFYWSIFLHLIKTISLIPHWQSSSTRTAVRVSTHERANSLFFTKKDHLFIPDWQVSQPTPPLKLDTHEHHMFVKHDIFAKHDLFDWVDQFRCDFQHI